MFASAIFIATSFFFFSLVFPPEKKDEITLVKKVWLALPPVIIAILLFATNLFVKKVNPEGSLAQKITFDPVGYGLFTLCFLGSVIWASAILIKKYRNSSAIIKQQILYLGLGVSISMLIAVFSHAILPLLGSMSLIWAAPIYPLFFIGAAFYSIVRYRLLDIQVIIKRTTVYLILVTIIVSLYVFVLMLIQQIFPTDSSRSVFLMVIIAAVIAATIQPLRNWLDAVTDSLFFQKRIDYYEVLEKTSRELNSVIKMQDALNVVLGPFKNVVHLKFSAIYINEKINSPFICQKTGGDAAHLPELIDPDDFLVEYLKKNNRVLETGEFRHNFSYLYQGGNIIDQEKASIQNELDNIFKSELILPIFLKTHLIGFMVLGEKLSGDQFTNRDLTLLETLASQMSTTLENIRLYEQMLNSERLAVIGTMSASIAHEIRNPLASIEMFIQMLPDKYAKPDFRKTFDEIVPSEIERLGRITADLLSFSKPSSPNLESIHISTIIERIQSLLNNQMKRKMIQIEAFLDGMPSFQADAQQIQQVFLNMILNSIQASQTGSTVKVSAEVKIDKKLEKFIWVSIADEGSGIKKKDMVNLFQPFFTTKPEGTGLGLATCKRIVEAHNGEIKLVSEEGKGTTFTVILPLQTKLQHAQSDQIQMIG
jgi:signal transduction histidine kinase